ncbi:CRISPR-associated protein Cas4 [Paenibacillus sp. HB172176]|uniref:CRISPR-associated protein Cas4 n=1 Tax=Paenibacillus sp. HB172176 TaxID=2493690 RepID=UPI00143A2A96|nr:CRISPR-associated protein Cas4 [Paenibacillus sp. HB172176]
MKLFENEDDYLMLSGIQHFKFCKRQWALIHIEQQWKENVLTVEGQHLHEKADQPSIREKRGDKLIVRAMSIKSPRLGLSGRCDVVEFVHDQDGVPISGEEGNYRAVPVEYKRGKPKRGEEDVLQLAAQAVCLEDMLLCEVRTGYIFYHEIKRRVEVDISKSLKSEVVDIACEMQEYYRRRHTPKVKTGAFCRSCSLEDLCMPELMSKRSVKGYLEGKIAE